MTPRFQASLEAIRQATDRLRASNEQLAAVMMPPDDPEWAEVGTVTVHEVAPIIFAVDVMSDVAPVATDETVAALWETLRDLVPADDWLNDDAFKVGDWYIVINDTENVYQRPAGNTVARMVGFCNCHHCVQRRTAVPGVEFTRARGMHLYSGGNTVAHKLARAIALKLALETDPDEVDHQACG